MFNAELHGSGSQKRQASEECDRTWKKMKLDKEIAEAGVANMVTSMENEIHIIYKFAESICSSRYYELEYMFQHTLYYMNNERCIKTMAFKIILAKDPGIIRFKNFIYYSEVLQATPPELRKKIADMVTIKCVLAFRDYGSKEQDLIPQERVVSSVSMARQKRKTSTFDEENVVCKKSKASLNNQQPNAQDEIHFGTQKANPKVVTSCSIEHSNRKRKALMCDEEFDGFFKKMKFSEVF